MWALITRQGTAMAETALCELCLKSPICRNKAVGWATDDAASEVFVDCYGNPELTCQYCGSKV